VPLHELTQEHRDFAERNHNYVYGFLRWKRLRADDFYGIVIPGYLTAVQIYCDRAKLRENYAFSTISWNQMEFKLKDYFRQQSLPMRKAVTVSLEAMIYNDDVLPRTYALAGSDLLFEELDAELLWEEITGFLTTEQAEIINLRSDGYSVREIAARKRRKYTEIQAMLACIRESIPESCLAYRGRADALYLDRTGTGGRVSGRFYLPCL